MIDESAFLAAICATPQDDSPRLCFADWLEDRGRPGDSERAEFIRVQCALAGLDLPQDAAVQLRRRERELLHIYGYQWTRHPLITLNARSLDWQRGFIAEITCTLDAWCCHGPAIVRVQPVEAVRISDREPWYARIASRIDRYAWWVDVFNEYAWWVDVFNEAEEGDRSDLPRDIFESLPQAVRHGSCQPGVYFNSPQAAHAALSTACLTWAKNTAKPLDSSLLHA